MDVRVQARASADMWLADQNYNNLMETSPGEKGSSCGINRNDCNEHEDMQKHVQNRNAVFCIIGTIIYHHHATADSSVFDTLCCTCQITHV